MLDNNIISPSSSEWVSPLHIVTKKDNSFRPCGDYRRLNDLTIPYRYPIPRIQDFQHILTHKIIFSKIDLFKAYFHIPIADEDKEKTAIVTPFSLSIQCNEFWSQKCPQQPFKGLLMKIFMA